MKKQDLSPEKAQEILESLDEAIAKGPWEDSNFLRVIGKKLMEIRDKYIEFLNETLTIKSASSETPLSLPRSGQQEVFIALYSAEGNRLQSWERIIANLPRQIISRPIYAEEEHVQSALKAKENKMNEGYVSVVINQNDLLPLPIDKVPKDKFGKSLLSLKDRAIQLDNINYFYHFTGKYRYVKGRLIKQHD